MRESVNVLFATPGMPEAVLQRLKRQLDASRRIKLLLPDCSDEATLLEAAAQAEVLVSWRIAPNVLAAMPKLKLWVFPGAGVQGLIPPLRELNARQSVTLVNSHGNAGAVAEHAVTMLLALLHRITLHHNWMAAGQWRKSDEDAATLPLRGRRVGLLGYGAINRQVHQLLSGYNVACSALRHNWDSSEPEPPTPLTRYTPSELAPFLKASDVLMIAVPATALTEGLIGAEELAQLGRDGVLVNVARGAVVAEQPLYEALRDGVIGGAALDVWYDYHPQPDAQGRSYPSHFPFHELPDVLLSPHRSASPIFAPERWDDIADNILCYVNGQPLRNIVDLDRGY